MSARADVILDDLRQGRLTQEAVDLVTRSALAIARTGRYTTASGSRRWSHDDVEDLVGDFFASPGRIFDLATGATDGTGLVRRIETTLERVIIDRLRRGPVGVLHRRIDRRMKRRSDVIDVRPQHWCMTGSEAAPHWTGNDDDLVRAANVVAVAPPPDWPDDSSREAPATTTRSLDDTCTAVLETARAPVPRPTVRRIVANRIIPVDPAHVIDPPTGYEPESPAPRDIGDREAAAAAAAAFWAGLSGDDRLLLPNVRVPSRQLEADGFLNLKKSAIDTRQRRLEQHLIMFITGMPDAELVVHHLLGLQEDWAAGQSIAGAP